MRNAAPARHSRLGGRGGDDLIALFKSACVQLFSVGLNAAQSILLPLMVGPAAFGLFAGIYTNVMVAVGVGRGPIEILVQRGHTHGPRGGTMIYRKRELFQVFAAGLLLAIALFIGLSVMQRWSVSLSLGALLTVAVGVGAASGLRRGLLISTSRTSQLELLDMVARPAIFLAGAGICWWMGMVEPLLLWLLAGSFILVLAWPNLRAVRKTTTIVAGNESAFRPWSYVLGSSGLSILVKNADVIVLGMFLDPATVGRYFIVARIADLAAFGYSFAAARFVHRFAVARRNGDHSEAAQVIRQAGRFGLAVASIVAVAILLAAPLLLPLIDRELSNYLLPLAILLCAQVINATLGVRGAFLTAIDPRYTLGLKLLINPLALGAMILAVPAFGPLGAATVAALFVFAMQLANTVLLRRVLEKEATGVTGPAGVIT